MGYYTAYNLKITPNNNNILEEFSVLHEGYGVDWNGESSGECKWYEHEDDLKEFSIKYPQFVFTLKGNGEETGDLWIKYFKGGKMQRSEGKVTFEPFDVDKLV